MYGTAVISIAYFIVARSRNRKKKATEETICPVCNLRVSGTPEELNEHVELCLKKVRNNTIADLRTRDVAYVQLPFSLLMRFC